MNIKPNEQKKSPDSVLIYFNAQVTSLLSHNIVKHERLQDWMILWLCALLNKTNRQSTFCGHDGK